MSDRYTERLSEYLDQELEAVERSDMERHLLECPECATALAGLKRVVTRASALANDEPEPRLAAELWPGIEARIQPRPKTVPLRTGRETPDRRRSFSVPQLVAACLVAAVLSGAAVWFAQTRGPRETGELIPGSARAGAEPASTHPGANATAVEELRAALASGRDDLDPATVRTLEESLMVIEIAIHEARRALDADPRNPYVRAHLDETMRRKVELLHRATMLASAPR